MLMTNSPADVVRFALIALGGGSLPSSASDWPIGWAQEDDTPDNFITVYDTSGIVEGRIQNDGEVPEHPGIQIRVRSYDPTAAWLKINSLAELLDKSINNTIVHCMDPIGTGSSSYLLNAATRKGTVLSLGRDAPNTKRALFTVNYTVTLRQLN